MAERSPAGDGSSEFVAGDRSWSGADPCRRSTDVIDIERVLHLMILDMSLGRAIDPQRLAAVASNDSHQTKQSKSNIVTSAVVARWMTKSVRNCNWNRCVLDYRKERVKNLISSVSKP